MNLNKEDQLQRLYPVPSKTVGVGGAVLSYLGPFCLIPYFSSKKDHFTRHHSQNGMLLFLAGWPCAIISIICFSLISISKFQEMRLWGLLSLFLLAYCSIVGVLTVIFSIYGALRASAGKTFRLITLKSINYFWSYVFMTPSLSVFATFAVVPVFMAIGIAFMSFQQQGSQATFVGLANFSRMWTDEVFWIAMKNTFIYTVVLVPESILVSLILASVIYPLNMKSQTFFRSAYYLPGVTSAVIIAVIWRWLFKPTGGLFNWFLSAIGFDGVLLTMAPFFENINLWPFPWLNHPYTSLPSIMVARILTAPGVGVILYLAAMGRIPETLVEASKIDGAGALRRWWTITVPLVKPTTLYLVVVNTIYSFQVFDQIYIMTSGGPGYSSTPIVLRIYESGFQKFEFGYASAQALVLFAIIITFSLINYFALKTDVEY